MTDHKCPRCGTPLKVVVVKRPVYHQIPDLPSGLVREVLVRVDEVEETSDCVRCTGGY